MSYLFRFKNAAVALGCFAYFLGEASAVSPPPRFETQLFFKGHQYFSESLSPDGEVVAFLSTEQNRNRIGYCLSPDWQTVRWVECPSAGSVGGFFWTGRPREIFFTAREQDGKTRFFTDRLGDGEPCREIAADSSQHYVLQGFIAEAPPRAILGLWREGGKYQDGYDLNLETGTIRKIFENSHGLVDWTADAQGQVRAGIQYLEDGAAELCSVSGDSVKPIFRVNSNEMLFTAGWGKDGAFYVITNRGENNNVARLESVDLDTGKTETVFCDPLDRVDIGGVISGGPNQELLGAYFTDEKMRTYFSDTGLESVFREIQDKVGDGDIMIRSMDRGKQRVLFSLSKDTEPGISGLYDAASKTVEILWRARPDISSDQMASMEPICYRARDGVEIPAYLTLPRSGCKPFPLVLFPHGGPRLRTFWGFDGRVQFLANRGYAVLQPNYRGSKGYGKNFLNAGNREWGGKMQDDITDGVAHLVAGGIADPKRIAIFGGSYGGYAALAGLAFTPDLYAAGICLFGASDLEAFVNEIPCEWHPYIGQIYANVGENQTEEGREFLRGRSPVHFTENIRAPLFIYHGVHDKLIRKSQSDRFVEKLKTNGQSVTYIVFDDEGHGFSKSENEAAIYDLIEAFLEKHLKPEKAH